MEVGEGGREGGRRQVREGGRVEAGEGGREGVWVDQFLLSFLQKRM